MKGRTVKNEATYERMDALATMQQESDSVRALLLDYLGRTGLKVDDFARRINYSGVTLRFFLDNRYYNVGRTDIRVRKAVKHFIETHPIEPPQRVSGELYDTANVRTIRETFQKLLPKPVAYMVYAPPGSQKSFVLEHEVARLNQEELHKNGHGQRAYYVYARQNLRPRDLIRRVCIACGSHAGNDIDRMLSNLRFDFQTRRTLLVVDEAQHLEIECFEVLRELLDQPPFFSLLFAGSHDLKQKFDRFSATLEQWNSRIIAKVKLPGLQPQEAEGIILREIGHLLAPMPEARRNALIEGLMKQATTKDAFEKARTYINIRTLTNALDQISQAHAAKIGVPVDRSTSTGCEEEACA
ncbi:ATP-binding protein [Alloacidobacterium dinghuense]|uniref:ATP-binding protein n=1 Tax=Alloacidobacterium dinghuense TaxID=2763107 RepID=A0A7G8BPP1_9BACT|nr:ATP-binding protein [Alloacidobacterium dinghuense]QNI34511.1 ATP-binding protein [Alloacidobacterium dinghuense]